MVKCRSIPYIIGICIIILFVISYVGYRAYQKHVEFQEFMSNAQMFNRSVAGHHEHSAHDHADHGAEVAVASDTNRKTGHEHRLAPSGEYVYDINGISHYSDTPMSQADIEFQEWVQTGQMSPAVEEQLRIREELKSYVQQVVVTPDGKLYMVTVPRHSQYEEGDAVLQSELGPHPPMETPKIEGSQMRVGTLIKNGVEYPPPAEFDLIDDPYEREEYLKKFVWSVNKGISMVEVEREVEKGALSFTLSETEKRNVDEREAMKERSRIFSRPPNIPLSDKPPVKVSLRPDEGNDASPGWVRKLEGTLPPGSGGAKFGGAYSATDSVPEEARSDGARSPSFGSDVPVSPSDRPDMVKPTPSPPSEADIEKQLMPEGIEAELSGELSTDSFDKAQQFIDEYGTEEGLRRLREMDPDAARRFERERRGAPKDDDYSDDQPPDDSP